MHAPVVHEEQETLSEEEEQSDSSRRGIGKVQRSSRTVPLCGEEPMNFAIAASIYEIKKVFSVLCTFIVRLIQ